jgi:hypothetical protein
MRFGCDILIRNIVMGVGVPPGRVFRSAVNYVMCPYSAISVGDSMPPALSARLLQPIGCIMLHIRLTATMMNINYHIRQKATSFPTLSYAPMIISDSYHSFPMLFHYAFIRYKYSPLFHS